MYNGYYQKVFIVVFVLSCCFATTCFAQIDLLWSSEIIGMDLVHKFPSFEKNKTSIAIIDNGFNLKDIPTGILSREVQISKHRYDRKQNHGTHVLNLIFGNDKFSFGDSQNLQLIKYLIDGVDKKPKNQITKIETDYPALVCSSLSVATLIDPETQSIFKNLYQNKSIIVIAAGNLAQTRHGLNMQEKVGFKFIRVGAIDRTGLVAGFSEDGPDLIVLAPGDRNPVLSNDKKTYFFSGTSAAQPIVCGIIQRVLAIIPGLSQEALLTLIQKTSLPVANLDFKKKNVGIINPVKLIAVAINLKSQYWSPAISHEQQLALVGNENIYNPADLLKLNLIETDDRFTQLRYQFYINPQPEKAKLLAQIYQKQNRIHLANYFYSLHMSSEDFATFLTKTDNSYDYQTLQRFIYSSKTSL